MAKKNLRERLRQQQKDLKTRGGGYKFFGIPEGTTRFRHLPTGEEQDFAIEATVFFLGKDIGYVVSPMTWGDKCAIMKGYKELSDSKKEADRKFAKTFKPNTKFFSPVIKFKDSKGKEIDLESGVKLLMLSTGTYNDLIDLYLDVDEAGDFTSAKKGYDIKYGRTGKGKTDTEYSVQRCNPTELDRKFAKKEYSAEEMLRGITPSYKDTKELLDRFLNLEPDEEDDDEDEIPKKKKKKKSRDL